MQLITTKPKVNILYKIPNLPKVCFDLSFIKLGLFMRRNSLSNLIDVFFFFPNNRLQSSKDLFI